MKKILAIILSMVLIIVVCPLGLFSVTASAATAGTTGNCKWIINGDILTISGNGKMKDYNYSSPWSGQTISRVVIEEGVTYIGANAFADCKSLGSITIPDSVASIGRDAFYSTAYYNTLSNWEDNLLYIGKHVVANKFSLQSKYSIRIKDGTLIVANGVLSSSRLTQITIPDSVVNIGTSPFSGCENLTTAVIGNGITEIVENAFKDCSNLKSVSLGTGITKIASSAFEGCTALNNITLPNSLICIDNEAFYDCIGLTEITIPNSVTSIGSSAFSHCTGLTEITIPNSVTSIGSSAFSGTEYYKNLSNWDDGVLYINNHLIDVDAQRMNSSSYIIKSGTLTVADSAFYDYTGTGLTEITIPNSVTSIGSSAFSCCTGLTEITIPNSVTSIGSSAFSGCTGLTQITIPNSVTSMGSYAFSGCTGLTEITIPNSVTSIGLYAFSGCTGLTEITIPNSVTSIGSSAFKNCTGLTSITIPDSVTIIDDEAFYNCSSLISVTIGNGVERIEDLVFWGCDLLESVYITDIAAWCNINFSNDRSWNYANPLFLAKNLYLNDSPVTELVIPDGITYIDNDAFAYCNSLRSVIIPDSVTQISERAFQDCDNLTSVTIGNGVKSIGNSAFGDCDSLKSVYITDITAWCNIDFNNYATSNPLSYAKNLYLNNSLVTDLVIPDDVINIESYVFYNCKCFRSITIPDSVTSIGYNAFNGCTNLTRVTFIGDITSFGDGSFGRCNNIKEISFGNERLNYSFDECTMLERIYLPKDVSIIYSNTFPNSNNIIDIYYEGTEEEWNNVVIQHSNGSLSTATIHYNSTGIPQYTSGDIDGVEGVTDRDAVYLLYHTFLSDIYPVNQDCDFNGDGEVNDKDAVYLLYHTFLPDLYPID